MNKPNNDNREKSSKYDISETDSNSKIEEENRLLSHQLELNLIEKNKKEFELKKLKNDSRINIIQLLIVNMILISIICLSVLYVNKLIGLIKGANNPNAIWILGSFTLGITLSVLYICGSTIKAVFGLSDKDNNNHILRLLEEFFKVKNKTHTKK